MQAETLTRICPLCRRAADGEQGLPGTRLCGDCRAMLDPILPRAGFVQPDYAVALAGTAALQPASYQASLTREVDFDEASLAPAIGIDEDFAPLNEDEGAAEAFIAHGHAPGHYEEPEVFIAPDQYEDDIEPANYAAPSTPAPAPVARAGAAAETVADENVAASDLRTGGLSVSDTRPALEADAAIEVAPAASADTAGLLVERAAAPPADPWDDPLPAWEYSHREWPLLVKDEKPSLASKLKWPLVAAAVIIGIAATSYLFFFKRASETPVTQHAVTVPAEPPPTAAPPVATSPAATEEIKAATPAAANPTADGQWKHALQAMASPNEGEANAFAERLKSAAIPAYLVRADKGGHVWYRVRVGRFATVEEAQRYIVEARNRARAAGVALKELQVTAYDKP